MAKKRTDEERTDASPDTGEITGTAEENAAPTEQAPAAKDITPFVENILRAYPAYETLYIDSHGSCYTPGTPACLRKGAALYANPFYKP